MPNEQIDAACRKLIDPVWEISDMCWTSGDSGVRAVRDAADQLYAALYEYSTSDFVTSNEMEESDVDRSLFPICPQIEKRDHPIVIPRADSESKTPASQLVML